MSARAWKPDSRLRRDHTRPTGDPTNQAFGGSVVDTLGLVGPVIETTRGQDRAAALACARAATGPDDLRELLAALGLTAERCAR